jgi:RHS repeat-associated protein
VSYLTADHLGSPRVITNQNGAVTTRKDYMAFGDEATSAQRTANPNYDSSETRKGYTGYEKDTESGLEFAQARYYNATHGRFTSIDPLTASASIRNPQTFNRYSYVLNSPYKFVDPLGLISSSTGACGRGCANTKDDPGGGLGLGLFSENGQTIQIGYDQQQSQQTQDTPRAITTILTTPLPSGNPIERGEGDGPGVGPAEWIVNNNFEAIVTYSDYQAINDPNGQYYVRGSGTLMTIQIMNSDTGEAVESFQYLVESYGTMSWNLPPVGLQTNDEFLNNYSSTIQLPLCNFNCSFANGAEPSDAYPSNDDPVEYLEGRETELLVRIPDSGEVQYRITIPNFFCKNECDGKIYANGDKKVKLQPADPFDH